MRRLVLALAAVVGATGCNWAFGLSATQTWDAGDAAPDSPPGIRTHLVWAAVTTDGMGDPDATITYAGIGSETTRPEVPVIEIGPLDATMGALVNAPYDTSDGSFEIPYTLRDAPHRIVYKLPSDPTPHEVQWSVTGATLVVPRYMRMNAPLVAPNSGFTITPQGSGGGNIAMVSTSGTFTVNDVPADFDSNPSATTVTLRYSDKARPLSMPTGGFKSVAGDWVLVTDWAGRPGGEASVTAWALVPNLDLAPSTLSVPTPQPTWTKGDRTMTTVLCPGPNCLPPFGAQSSAEARMNNALGSLIVQSTHGRRMRYGVVPSTEVPPYIPGVAPDYTDRPAMLYFAEAFTNLTAITVADPSAMIAYPRVITSMLFASRPAQGVNLVSSTQEMLKEFTSVGPTWKAPFAKSIMLGSTSLSGADDAAVPASTSQTTLVFSPDNGNANDFIITLYELANSALTPMRIYHVTAAAAKIDASLLQTGHRYVFGITSRVGLPLAAQGDYRTVAWPFATATTMAATFVIQ